MDNLLQKSPHLQVRLFPKDVKSSLMLEELSLEAAAPCRGCQILPCKLGTHLRH